MATIAQVAGSGTGIAMYCGLSSPVAKTDSLPLEVNLSITALPLSTT
jgi:hypothetical protein